MNTKTNRYKWFTLVELIVVITILAILWTVAYLSFWWYSKDARDTTRSSDMKLIEDSIVLSLTKRWVVPEPTNAVNITYSGGTLFKQWTFWKSSFENVWRLNKVPVDPLFWNEYTFSISSTRRAYQIWWILEWTQIETYSPIYNKANAVVTTETVPFIKWTYNWQIVHTSTWWKVYILAIPSLILSDTSDTNVLNVWDKIVFNWEAWIPESYSEADIPVFWHFSFTPTLVYSWTSLPRTPTSLKPLVSNLQDSLLWTILFSHEDYQELLTIDIDNADELQLYWTNYINNKLWWRFESRYLSSCKGILWDSDSNQWSWLYTISPDWASKIEVYCDMEMNWWWWTRINAYDYSIWWYTDQKLTSKTRWITWTELVAVYTRVWISNIWKKFWVYYDRFKIKQYDQNGLCWEHTTISDLVSHVTGWTWWDCSRSWDSSWWWSLQNNPLEYIDIQVDDLWWLPWTKTWTGFTDDSCVTNGNAWWDRNVHWDSTWLIEHRFNSDTTIISLWWRWYYHNYCWWNHAEVWIKTIEVYVR